MRRLTLPALLLAVAAVSMTLAACGGSTSGTSYSAPKPTSTAAAAAPATIGTRHTALGTVLVDAQGRTLYLFEGDKGSTSTCSGSCAAAWPPATTASKAQVKGDAVAGKLGASKLADGTSIVTYGGHPLYTYAGDAAPGDTNGQDLDQFGAEWYVLAPSGDAIEAGVTG